MRCPYSYWLIFTGEITFEESLDDFSQQAVSNGIAFEDAIVATAMPTSLGLDQYAEVDIRILGTQTFENHHLRIRGRPDGIDTQFGQLIPIEIKSHQIPTGLDELELAFYWLLLEPFRSRTIGTPRGTLILRQNGRYESISIKITEQRIDQVHEYLAEIRRARRHGVEPRICGCNVCVNLRRDEVRLAVSQRRDISMIHGVGVRYAKTLQSLGYKTWTKLLEADPDKVAADFKARGILNVSVGMVAEWQVHAQSFESAVPMFIPPVEPLDFPFGFIALDLEYEPIVWLIGATFHGDQHQQSCQWPIQSPRWWPREVLTPRA